MNTAGKEFATFPGNGARYRGKLRPEGHAGRRNNPFYRAPGDCDFRDD
jgi:hypothetical protein